MEAAASVAAGRGGQMASSQSSSSRKEWRAIPEQKDMEREKLGQRGVAMYEDGNGGVGGLDVDFCAITIDNGGDINGSLEQQLHEVSRQREDFEQIEINIRANLIARVQLMGMRNEYEGRINEHVQNTEKLKEKLQEREHNLHELEMQMEDKDRELCAVKIDNEQAWAKDDLLREQNNELATFRRERDNSEAERCQLLKQIHDLNDHIQEKERHYAELEEQHRVAQETIQYKDAEMREIQAWCARVQETDGLRQIEFRDRAESFSQFWHSCQVQFANMDAHIQQLQLQLAEANERNGYSKEDSRTISKQLSDASQLGHEKGSQHSLPNGAKSNSDILPNGNIDGSLLTGSALTKAGNIPGYTAVSSPVLGMNAYLQPGQVSAFSSYVMHQQPHVGEFQAVSAISAHQQWQKQQAMFDNTQIANQNQYLTVQPESGSQSEYILPANDQGAHTSKYHEAQDSPNQEAVHAVSSSIEDSEKVEAEDTFFPVTEQPQSNQHDSIKFHDVLEVDSPKQISATKGQEESMVAVVSQLQESDGFVMEQPSLPVNSPHQVNAVDAAKMLEPTLLDERSLLACIVRAIGSGGGVRITSTLPNRLGKMLAPLHWHDYKKKYGKLDDFVSGHSELFQVEGDFIQLREGAQVIISATTARAKVAAAKDSGLSSSLMPSVAVTPVSQNHLLKKMPSVESKPLKTNATESSLTNGLTNVKFLSKPKDRVEMNGLPIDLKAEHSSLHNASGNGAVPMSQHRGSVNPRNVSNYEGRQQARPLGTAQSFRR